MLQPGSTPGIAIAKKDVDDDDKESILRCVFRLDIGKDVEGRGFGMRFCSPDWVS